MFKEIVIGDKPKGLLQKYVRWMMKRKGYIGYAMPWFETIFYLDKPDSRLRRHEQCHAKQIEKDGKLLWTINYYWYQLKYGYENNPYEIEAREAEDKIR